VDVVDQGIVTSQFGEKHKCRIVWELSESMDDQRPFLASKQYTVSLHEKSSLHKDLKSWRGKPFTPDELNGFDVEKIIGAPCQLVITHEEKDGITYGNVTAILRANKKTALKPSGDYVRYKDRTENQKADNGKSVQPEPEAEDDGDPAYETGSMIPF
jgi:hypothetical protein